MIQISCSVLISLALLILLFPLKWLLSTLLAALIHEMGHILVLLVLGGKIHSIMIRSSGAIINAWIPSETREITSILAGPASSLLLMFLYPILPEVSVCAGIQGLFNLLPIYPLDGGRIRRHLLSKTSRMLFTAIISTLLLIITFFMIRHLFPLSPKQLLCFAPPVLFAVMRNTPCKEE